MAGLTRADGISVGAFLVASFGAYAVGSVMVYSFGIGVAVERGMKVDLLMRVMPVPPGVYLLAKVITALFFSLVSLVVLIIYGIAVGGVTQPPLVWVEMIVRLLVGSVPFIGLGFAIGYMAGPHSAPAVANLVYLPAGLRLRPLRAAEPAPALRPELRAVPADLSLRPARVGIAPRQHRAARGEPRLAGRLRRLLFFAVALRAYRGDEQRKFELTAGGGFRAFPMPADAMPSAGRAEASRERCRTRSRRRPRARLFASRR